jgi:hypothetical protein
VEKILFFYERLTMDKWSVMGIILPLFVSLAGVAIHSCQSPTLGSVGAVIAAGMLTIAIPVAYKSL